MKISYVELSGFRGYRTKVRIDFADEFTVIDGRNGVGKSTIFDAVEFALTGHLSKYRDAKASGESVSDYIWWSGEERTDTRYVEIGIKGNESETIVRRTPFVEPSKKDIEELEDKLVDLSRAPKNPLQELCSVSIIRDEHIASLSLDLKETERYKLLRQAIGANDSEFWVERGKALASAAKTKREDAARDIENATARLAAAQKRIDESRRALASDSVISAALTRVSDLLDEQIGLENGASKARSGIAESRSQIEKLEELLNLSSETAEAANSKKEYEAALSSNTAELRKLEAEIEDLPEIESDHSHDEVAERARRLISLVEAGKSLGLQDNRCPVCFDKHTKESFANGLESVQALALQLDQTASELASAIEHRRDIEDRAQQKKQEVGRIADSIELAEKFVASFEEACLGMGFATAATQEEIEGRLIKLSKTVEDLSQSLRVLETASLNTELGRSERSASEASEEVHRAQERFSRARRSEEIATSLKEASVRAASETLDLRLERVLPLMSELYKRLRPHPIWQDIDYSIRGDVRRFLSLQVGDGKNPQFIFSSGQRRATGIAFLLSVHLSIAWNKLNSILLDDPVQHVDDFRAVNLAEVFAQLVSSGRQVICAVEDPALADMLCRRLPVRTQTSSIRYRLGRNQDGTAGVKSQEQLRPLIVDAFSEQQEGLVS
ncbi:MAG: AAA family ATPase [Hyphomicrobiales bacterium]|nr:AAA family ATPase [Hyphomicrobiales bacterium]